MGPAAMTNKAFTLIEILVALMLTGLLSALALAPVVTTVRQITQLQEDYADYAAMAKTIDFISNDIRRAIRLSANVITILDHEALGGWDDDTLLIMSSAPNVQNLASGTVVYRVDDGGIMRKSIPGLYRWVIPGKVPNEVNADKLEAEDGQLVLPNVNAFCVEIPTKDDNRKEYAGPLPVGVYLKLGRGERENFHLPEKEDKREYERYIALP